MDEDLAEAIYEEFYNSYKTWKDDHFQDTVNQKVIVQDKVNYAVSEREDRVTRMAGCKKMNWAATVLY